MDEFYTMFQTICVVILFPLFLVYIASRIGRRDAERYETSNRRGYNAGEYINDGTQGGRAPAIDPTNNLSMKDASHLDNWGLGWDENGNPHLPPAVNWERLDWKSMVDPNDLGEQGARKAFYELSKHWGHNERAATTFSKMVQEHRRVDSMLQNFDDKTGKFKNK